MRYLLKTFFLLVYMFFEYCPTCVQTGDKWSD